MFKNIASLAGRKSCKQDFSPQPSSIKSPELSYFHAGNFSSRAINTFYHITSQGTDHDHNQDHEHEHEHDQDSSEEVKCSQEFICSFGRESKKKKRVFFAQQNSRELPEFEMGLEKIAKAPSSLNLDSPSHNRPENPDVLSDESSFYDIPLLADDTHNIGAKMKTM